MLIAVTGDLELDAALSTLEEALQKRVLRAAARDAAKHVKNEAVRNLGDVVDGDAVSENSFKVKAARFRKKDHKLGAATVAAPLNVGEQFFLHFMEFGTEPRVTKSGAYRGRVPKKKFKFLRPALYDSSAEVKAIFLREMRTRFAKIVKSHAKRHGTLNKAAMNAAAKFGATGRGAAKIGKGRVTSRQFEKMIGS